MSQIRLIVGALKQTLRAQKITYAAVATAIGMSEASVKRMFSRASFTLERLEQISAMAGVRVSELARMAEEQPEPVTALAPDQERELLADQKLLLVTFMVLNGWGVDQIVETFAIEELEVIRKLAQLDRLGMIELLPGNRIRRLVARNFSWRKAGPVTAWFEREVKKDFLDHRFDGPDQYQRFMGGLMSRDSVRRMHQAMNELIRTFDDLVQADTDLDLDAKIGVGAVFALRPWEAPAFRALRRGGSN